MNDSQRRTHYRTVYSSYSSNQKRLDAGTVLGIALVLLALAAFFVVLMSMQ